jgi:hypothetical protein
VNRVDDYLNGVLYVALGVFGAVWGVFGSFSCLRSMFVTVLLCLANFGLARLAGWAVGTRTAAVIPTLTWIVAVMLFSLPRSEGDVIFPSTDTGQVYLFLLGGAAAAGLAIYLTPASRSFLTGQPHDPPSRSR